MAVNAELQERIERVRAALEARSVEPRIDSVGPPCMTLPSQLAGLGQLAAFLKVANGAYCNGLQFYDAGQLLEWGPHEWLPGGEARWITVGYNMDLPLAMNRLTEEVVELDADSKTDILRSYGAFDEVLERGFSSRYREFSGMVISELKHDPWYQLLCELGLAEQV
jgi:hypothetical protein